MLAKVNSLLSSPFYLASNKVRPSFF